MTFGQQLKALRQNKGLSQDTLAGMLFVTRQSVSQWENDRAMPSVDLLVKLSGIFEISVDELLGKPPAEEKPVAGFVTENSIKNIKKAIKDENYILNTILLTVGLSFFVMAILIVFMILCELNNNKNLLDVFVVSKIMSGVMSLFGALGIFAAYLICRLKQSSKAKNYLKNIDCDKTEVQLFSNFLSIIYINGEEKTYKRINNYEILKLVDSEYYYIAYFADGGFLIIDKENAQGYPEYLSSLMLANRRTVKNRKITENKSIGKSKIYKIKVIGIVLAVISIISLWISIIPASSFLQSINSLYGIARNFASGVMLYFLVFPLSSILYGVYYKRKGCKTKKNIVIGIVMTCVILFYGLMIMFGILHKG
jgi:transcriptional regulator with XRE-family HTH domain